MITAPLFESLRQQAVVLLTGPIALIAVLLIFFYSGKCRERTGSQSNPSGTALLPRAARSA